MLTLGQTVRLPRQSTVWTVGRVLGEGGQGVVYELVGADDPIQRLALKWYTPGSAGTPSRASVRRLVERGSPGPAFLWPSAIVEGPDTFGYVMPIRPEKFVRLSDVLSNRAPATLSAVVAACLALAHNFLQLHSQGLCYRDISFGNVFIDPRDGRILICDNDNVGVDGAEPGVVLGTRRFMAPEIVRRELGPSTSTDLHSLAVLTFYLLMVHHPLLGARELAFECLDRAAEDDLFGVHPVFVFDPADDTNRPDPVEHASVLANWPTFPPYVHQLFVQSFTTGLRDPSRRVRESVWRSSMARLLAGIVVCPWCGTENATDDGAEVRCWSCRESVGATVRLVVGDRTLVLNDGTRLLRHHVYRDYDLEITLGEVTRHPTKDLWGLRNSGPLSWQVDVPGRSTTTVTAGQTVALVPGTQIGIAGVTARIVG
ncbi:serine/threonine-protein kinase [Cellulomonas sp. URHD0024]|uniref:serine/threonine protein kinase n=1 Tax=Cellulomonas sp. URHD0024 TaxID=1302620 RepID=UPI0004017D19|nr:serine/threonine-protein kinase [Cellulomonas sp. URHD0024]